MNERATMKQIRAFRDKTAKEVAKELNISLPLLRAYERMEKTPSVETAYKFAEFMNWDVDKILFFNGQPLRTTKD